jgi:hypothetical protein
MVSGTVRKICENFSSDWRIRSSAALRSVMLRQIPW